jgi:hypothetical protein
VASYEFISLSILLLIVGFVLIIAYSRLFIRRRGKVE